MNCYDILENTDFLELMFQKGVDPNILDLERNENLLHKFFKMDQGYFASSKILFDEYLNMVFVLRNYRIPILKLLLEYRVNPFLKNKDGDDAFEIARKNGYQLFEPDIEEIEEFFDLEYGPTARVF